MNLELRKVHISDVCFDDECKIQDGCLYVNSKKLEDIAMQDSRIKSVNFDLARPGESVRIVPVKDVIEPRAKLEGGEAFPGLFKEDMSEVGGGITYALSGCALTTTGPIVGFQEGVIDMMGPGAQYTIYSQINHIVMVIEKKDYVDQHDHEEVVRMAGIRVAEYLGTLGFDYSEYESEFYEWGTIGEKYCEEMRKLCCLPWFLLLRLWMVP